MSAIRLAASSLVFAGFTLYGAVQKSKKLCALSELSALSSDLSAFAGRLELTMSPLDSIASAAARQSRIKRFWEALAAALSSGLAPDEAFENACSLLRCGEALPVLEELFSGLGSSNASAEAACFRFASERIGALAEKLGREAAVGVKLTNSLSVLMGLAAALLLL